MNQLVRKMSASKFLRHNAIFFTGSLFVGFLNYLYYPVLGRLLTPSSYGEVQTLTSLYLQISVFLTIVSYITIHVIVNTKDTAEQMHVVSALQRFAFIAGGIVLVALLLLSPAISRFLHFTSNVPFVLLLGALAVYIPVVFRIAYLRGKQLFGRASVTDGVSSAARLLLSTVLVLFVAMTQTTAVILGLLVAQFLSLGVGEWLARHAGFRTNSIRLDRKELQVLKPQLVYGAAILSVSLVGIVYQTVGILAIKHYFSPEIAGQYAGMLTISTIVYFLTVPFTGVMMSTVKVSSSLRQNYLRLAGALALIGLFGGAVVFVLAFMPSLTAKILIGDKYTDFIGLLGRMSLSMLFLAWANALLMYNIALRKYSFCISAIIALGVVVTSAIMARGSVETIVNAILACTALLVAILGIQTLVTGSKLPVATKGVL